MQERIVASSDGQIVLDIADIASTDSVPAFTVTISQDFGGRKVLMFEDDKQIGIFSEIQDNCKHIYFYASPLDLCLTPGNYAIEVTLDGAVMQYNRLIIPVRARQNRESVFAS